MLKFFHDIMNKISAYCKVNLDTLNMIVLDLLLCKIKSGLCILYWILWPYFEYLFDCVLITI